MKFTLTAIALVASFVAPVHATPQLRGLFAAIEATGTTIAIDDQRFCNDQNIMGMYTFQRNVIDQLTICVDNHKGDAAELRDTVLHESVHVAQACKGGPIFTVQSLLPHVNRYEANHVITTYPQQQHHVEIEARVIAADQDEVYVTNLIKEHCK